MPGIAVMPVGRFSPAPGLFVDRTESSIKIDGAMELYGPEANPARAESIRRWINRVWTSNFPDGYSVSCNITVTYRGPGSKAGAASQIEAIKIAGPSHVSRLDSSMTLNANEADAFTWTAAHEFGHVIGLQDRYSEGIMSSIIGTFGGTRSTTVDPRYQINLMAVTGGILESQNLKDVAEENAPSPYWVNDDEQVRDWINHHVTADVARLSTANKLKAIGTLMTGWISDADVAAIGRICSCVTLKAEADAIRRGIDLLKFSSIGQRTMMRVTLSQMP
jgi:hypothetical protein